MDTRFEGFVKVPDFVGGEEENTRIVFENAKEDRNHAVAAHVFTIAGLEEDIGFIELARWMVSFALYFENNHLVAE